MMDKDYDGWWMKFTMDDGSSCWWMLDNVDVGWWMTLMLDDGYISWLMLDQGWRIKLDIMDDG